MSPTMQEEADWTREIRADTSPRERQEYPTIIPWTHREGREELQSMGLAHLVMPDEEGEWRGAWRCEWG